MKRLAGQVSFGAFRILVEDPVKHQARFVIIAKPGVGLANLKRCGSKFGAHGVIGADVVEGIEGIVIAA